MSCAGQRLKTIHAQKWAAEALPLNVNANGSISSGVIDLLSHNDQTECCFESTTET